VAWLLGAFLAGYIGVVTTVLLRLWKSAFYTQWQKFFQTLIVIFIPIGGIFFVHVVMAQVVPKQPKPSWDEEGPNA
jgi:predicted ferric reductase